MSDNPCRTLAESLAEALPGAWSADEIYEHAFRLTRDDGMALVLFWQWRFREGEKASIRADLIEHPLRRHAELATWGYRDAPDLKAGFDATRPIGKIAKDVMRRVVTPYEPIYPALVEKRAEIQQALAYQQDCAEHAAKILSCELRGDLRKGEDATIYIYSPNPSATIRFTPSPRECAVQVQINSLTPAQATHVAEFLADLKRNKPNPEAA